MSKETLKEIELAISDSEKELKSLKRMQTKMKVAMITEQLNSAPSCDRRCCGNLPRKLAFGYWDCKKSPVGHCVYNDTMDRAHDECVFCEEPEQRS